MTSDPTLRLQKNSVSKSNTLQCYFNLQERLTPEFATNMKAIATASNGTISTDRIFTKELRDVKCRVSESPAHKLNKLGLNSDFNHPKASKAYEVEISTISDCNVLSIDDIEELNENVRFGSLHSLNRLPEITIESLTSIKRNLPEESIQIETAVRTRRSSRLSGCAISYKQEPVIDFESDKELDYNPDYSVDRRNKKGFKLPY